MPLAPKLHTRIAHVRKYLLLLGAQQSHSCIYKGRWEIGICVTFSWGLKYSWKCFYPVLPYCQINITKHFCVQQGARGPPGPKVGSKLSVSFSQEFLKYFSMVQGMNVLISHWNCSHPYLPDTEFLRYRTSHCLGAAGVCVNVAPTQKAQSLLVLKS